MSIAGQATYFMDVRQATGLFLDKIARFPRTDRPWREIQEAQESEYDGRPGYPYASNYESNWNEAGRLLAELSTELGIRTDSATSTDWFDEMATAQEKADYAASIAADVWATKFNDGQNEVSAPIFITEINRKVGLLPEQMTSAVIDTLRAPEFHTKLDAINTKLDALLALLAK